jgi:hypothetical protein
VRETDQSGHCAADSGIADGVARGGGVRWSCNGESGRDVINVSRVRESVCRDEEASPAGGSPSMVLLARSLLGV